MSGVFGRDFLVWCKNWCLGGLPSVRRFSHAAINHSNTDLYSNDYSIMG